MYKPPLKSYTIDRYGRVNITLFFWTYEDQEEYYRRNKVYTYEATIQYNDPKTAVVTIETPKSISLVEAENLIMEEFEDQYPEAVDPEIVKEVKELN